MYTYMANRNHAYSIVIMFSYNGTTRIICDGGFSLFFLLNTDPRLFFMFVSHTGQVSRT